MQFASFFIKRLSEENNKTNIKQKNKGVTNCNAFKL